MHKYFIKKTIIGQTFGIYFMYNFFPFIFISWRLITLQYCSGFCHTLTRISHGFTCVPHPEPHPHLPPHPIPLGHPSAPAPSTCLMYPTWTGDLFQCYSLRTSHPRLLPQILKVCTVHLCLFFCFAYRVIINIFKFHIYALVYSICLYLSGLFHSV